MTTHKVTRRRNDPRRSKPGFTLVEMVTSLAIISVLLLGLGSAVMVSSHAIPTGKETGAADQVVIDAVNRMRMDLREAQTIRYRLSGSDVEIQIAIKDSGALGVPAKVTYTFSNSSNTLSRQVDTLGVVVVAQDVSALSFSTTNDGSAGRVAYMLMRVDGTIQGSFEMFTALPNKPEVL